MQIIRGLRHACAQRTVIFRAPRFATWFVAPWLLTPYVISVPVTLAAAGRLVTVTAIARAVAASAPFAAARPGLAFDPPVPVIIIARFTALAAGISLVLFAVHILVKAAEAGAVLVLIITLTTHRLTLALAIISQHTIIMLSILQIIFRRHPIAGLLRVPRKAAIFFQQLAGVATLAVVEAVTIVIAASKLLRTRAAAAPTPPVLVVSDQLRVP